jgi:hypothetical protein
VCAVGLPYCLAVATCSIAPSLHRCEQHHTNLVYSAMQFVCIIDQITECLCLLGSHVLSSCCLAAICIHALLCFFQLERVCTGSLILDGLQLCFLPLLLLNIQMFHMCLCSVRLCQQNDGIIAVVHLFLMKTDSMHLVIWSCKASCTAACCVWKEALQPSGEKD